VDTLFAFLYGVAQAGHSGKWAEVQDPNRIEVGWQHYAVTYDDSTQAMTLYRNGEAVSEKIGVAPQSNTSVQLGQYDDCCQFLGMMDEVRIWDHARPGADIAADYNKALKGTEPGLLAYYNFNQGIANGDNRAIQTVSDLTGQHDGVLKGFALTANATSNFVASDPNVGQQAATTTAGNALHLDGSNDFIDAMATSTGLPQGREPRTMEVWVKTKQTKVGNILSWGRRATHMRNSMAVINGKLAFIGQSLDFRSNTPINDGEWHHVALAYDGANWAIYVDGQADGTNAADPNTTDQNLKIGNISAPSNGEYFNGTMDELRIWKVAKTAEEIAAHMNTELTGKEEGLVAYYNFNQGVAGGDNSTVTTLMDQAGENNGTLSGFSLMGDQSNFVTSGISLKAAEAVSSNNALQLDGSGDFVDATATSTGLPQGREPRTMEAWVKTKQTNIGNILSWGRRVSRMRNSMAVRNGKLAFIGQNLDFRGNAPINDGEWHHVALAYDGENWAIYVDGQADGTNTADPNTTDQNLKIGNISDPSNGEYFNGTMDELRIWKVARTAEEIAAHMNTELTGKEEDLVAYYNFNQGVAGGDNPTVTTLADQAGENNGTLSDFALTGDASNWVASNSAIQSVDASPVAEVFQHYVFGGNKVELAVGEYNAPLEIGSDGLSSLKVKPGYQVVLYEDADFKGASVTITEDVPRLGSSEWNFNDKASSIRVMKIVRQ